MLVDLTLNEVNLLISIAGRGLEHSETFGEGERSEVRNILKKLGTVKEKTNDTEEIDGN